MTVYSTAWFTVHDSFDIAGHGVVVTGAFDCVVSPKPGDRMEDDDARHWTIASVERLAAFLGRPVIAGEPVGILFTERPHLGRGNRLLFKGSSQRASPRVEDPPSEASEHDLSGAMLVTSSDAHFAMLSTMSDDEVAAVRAERLRIRAISRKLAHRSRIRAAANRPTTEHAALLARHTDDESED